MERISDEVLEYYAELFIEQGIREQGVTFERFLELPETYLKRGNPSARNIKSLALLLLGATLFFPSCRDTSDADSTASRFVDHYYVKVDLSRAKQFTDGLATRKIEQEQALLQGASTSEGTRHRDVTYRLLEKRGEGDHLFFVYDLAVKGQGAPTLKKRSLVSVGRVGGSWRITNFRDFDS